MDAPRSDDGLLRDMLSDIRSDVRALAQDLQIVRAELSDVHQELAGLRGRLAGLWAIASLLGGGTIVGIAKLIGVFATKGV